MHVLILYKKVPRHLSQKMINLKDILTFIL